jgi:hypothetical protein
MAKSQVVFELSDVDPEEFLASREDCNINERVIDDVLSEVQPTFAGEGVPADVLEMLKKLWLEKLKIHTGKEDKDNAKSSRTDVQATMEEGAPKPVQLGARPKVPIASGSGLKKTSKSKKKMTIHQVDGPNDSSDDDDELDNDDDDDDDDDDLDDDDDGDDILNDDEDGDGEGGEAEPLGSGDDISDEDPSDLFNTENVVVCQYDKIMRTRNKWKFHLKDGIMNLNGKDYVFQKASGEAEW